MYLLDRQNLREKGGDRETPVALLHQLSPPPPACMEGVKPGESVVKATTVAYKTSWPATLEASFSVTAHFIFQS